MMEKLVLLLIIFLICGFGLFLYHYKWQALYRDLGIDKVKDAVEKVNSIINAEKCRVDRIEEVFLDTKEEEIHELLMEKDFDNAKQLIK